jgi:hypothetical protein
MEKIRASWSIKRALEVLMRLMSKNDYLKGGTEGRFEMHCSLEFTLVLLVLEMALFCP